MHWNCILLNIITLCIFWDLLDLTLKTFNTFYVQKLPQLFLSFVGLIPISSGHGTVELDVLPITAGHVPLPRVTLYQLKEQQGTFHEVKKLSVTLCKNQAVGES